MLSIALLLLAVPPDPTDATRWALTIELPRQVDVVGVGLFEARSRTVFLLRGPLSRAFAERCSLEVESPLATARATRFVDASAPLLFEVDGAELRVKDGAALMPVGPVHFDLRVGAVGLGVMRATVEGQLRLHGARDGSAIRGDVELHHPLDRVEGPALVSLKLSSDALVRGTFTLLPTSAPRCSEIGGPAPSGTGR